MNANDFTAIFLVVLVISVGLRLWLARRQITWVAAHQSAVPDAFVDRIGLVAHRKAADYTVTRTRFGMVETLVELGVLLALTLGGILNLLIAWTGDLFTAPIAQDLALIVAVGAITSV